MEKLTPRDLESAQLPRALRGYRTEAVDKLLSSASRQLEAQLVEARRLQTELSASEAELARFRLQESTLKEALLLAQKAAEDARAAARQEAENILEAARLEAKEIRRQAQESVRALKWEAERLEAQRSDYSLRFRALLQEQLARLDAEPPTHAVLTVDSPETEAAAG